MHAIHPMIVDLTMITIYAGITTLLFKKIKQPMVLGYILAGVLAGSFIDMVPTVSSKEDILVWADIGVMFLLFALGLEFSFKKMISVGKSALITSSTIIICMLFLGYNVGLLMGWSTMDSFFLGSMISMSSTTIIIKAFDDLNLRKEKFTDTVFGVLVVEDIMGVLMLVLLPMIALGKNIDEVALGFGVLKLMFFLVICFVIGIFIVPTFLKKVKNHITDEMLLIITISLCFSMVLFAIKSGFSSALGAFIMGSILADTILIGRMRKIMEPLKNLFGAVFFVSVGMMVDPMMFVTYAGPILIITIMVILGQVAFATFGLTISGQSLKTSILCSFSLAQVGEFSFIIASLGMSIGVLSDKVYPIIVASSVLTTFFTPVMMRSAEPFFEFVKKIMPPKWGKYIQEHSTDEHISKSEDRLWQTLFKSYFIKMIIFSMILYTIVALSSLYIQPSINEIFPSIYGKILTTFITLFIMSPFLKALIGWETIIPNAIKNSISLAYSKIHPHHDKISSKKIIDEHLEKRGFFIDIFSENAETVKNIFVSNISVAKIYHQLWYSKKTNRLPLIAMTSFRLLMLSFFIVTVVHKFLTEDSRVTFGLLIFSVFMLSRSSWLFNQYMKMENQFLANLKGNTEEHHEEKDDAPKEPHFDKK